MIETHTLIIGASVAGLASAACLKKTGIEYTIIEKTDQVASPWRNHYERLHLHSNKRLSNLPFKKFDRAIPTYPTRQQVVDYLSDYQRFFDINPVFNTEVLSVEKKDNSWHIETSQEIYNAKNVIVAMGPFGKPKAVNIKGLESFPGEVTHSYGYKSGKKYKGHKVLVIGFGNSACEIAIDLHEQGAYPSMSVRSAVNVLPRDILGIPILQLGLLTAPLPPRFADKLNAPLLNFITGDIRKLGLKRLPYGPLEQIQKDQTIPLLDIGTLKLIKDGNATVYDGIDRIEGSTVHFTDGKKEDFNSIVAAIGYEKGFAGNIIKVDNSRFEDLKKPASKQVHFGEDGLYFCGFWIAPSGQIREIALDAQKIAREIAGKVSR